jgi:SAM-dependent methyltransferase
MAAAELTLGTFRDPAGSLRIVGDRVLRRVRRGHAVAAIQFLQSATGLEWAAQGRLIETELIAEDENGLTVEHPRVFFPSYPWEWTPSAWIAAADLTLDLCQELLAHGLILKDATPLNILFLGTNPVLVDVLSIEERDPASPLWLAYAQFVRTFLLPLAAHAFLGWPLAASIQNRDGYEPADLAPHLRPWQRWREPFRSLVTMPLMLESSGSESARNTKIRQEPEAALRMLTGNLNRLRGHLRHIENSIGSRPTASRWSGYASQADHYSAEDQEKKRRFVEEALTAISPSAVLDLGANSGVYSRIAAACGATVVAWDTDLQASQENFSKARQKHLDIAPVIANPARPTPAAGWRNAESFSLLDRARGRFDCVMMLGLIHHLLLSEQIPLHEILSLVRELTAAWAIVEWVPSRDPRFADLLRGRGELYAHLDEAAFVRAAERHFTVVLREALPNGRVLFTLQGR